MENSDKGKNNRGPWIIRRATKKGTTTCLRFPSDKEREKNKIRERTRRRVTSNIFAGLRANGGYELPKNADNNHVLIALCEEAGWYVEEDGSISRKDLNANEIANGKEKNHGKIPSHICHIQVDNLHNQLPHCLLIENMNECGVIGDNSVNLALSL